MWKTSPDVRGSSARTLIFKAEKRGLVTRLRAGLYNLVPFELGRATEYIGDPYVIAKELVCRPPLLSVARLRDGTAAYGHPAATHNLAQHLTSQSHGNTFMVTNTASLRLSRSSSSDSPKSGLQSSNRSRSVTRERSIFDGLRQPEYAGGIPEVAKALWMTRSEIKLNCLLDYAHRFDHGALRRRLGFFGNSTRWLRAANSSDSARNLLRPTSGWSLLCRSPALSKRGGACN